MQIIDKATTINSVGLLRLLPDNLPFYPYYNDGRRLNNNVAINNRRRQRRKTKKKMQEDYDNEAMVDNNDSNNGGYIPNQQLTTLSSNNVDGFTLFFFVDETNIQSLNAMTKVSNWFHVVFNRQQGDDERVGTTNDSRVICITNHPSIGEIEDNIRQEEEDTVTIRHNIHTSSTVIIPSCPMLTNSGFFHIPFHHNKRQALLHLLGVTRVPTIVVVNNNDGRIVTRYGWEAIEREFHILENWIVECDLITGRNKKDDDDDDGCVERDGEVRRFESNVVLEWEKGNSGLPLSWHLLSWII
jgi:hypothetical protein